MPKLEYAEFSELTKKTLRGLMDRIPAKHHMVFDGMLYGGEMRLLVEDLVATLAAERVAVTPAERDSLARMLAYLKEPATKLDQLIVTTRHS